jgi:hypothetical protein
VGQYVGVVVGDLSEPVSFRFARRQLFPQPGSRCDVAFAFRGRVATSSASMT